MRLQESGPCRLQKALMGMSYGRASWSETSNPFDKVIDMYSLFPVPVPRQIWGNAPACNLEFIEPDLYLDRCFHAIELITIILCRNFLKRRNDFVEPNILIQSVVRMLLTQYSERKAATVHKKRRTDIEEISKDPRI